MPLSGDEFDVPLIFDEVAINIGAEQRSIKLFY